MAQEPSAEEQAALTRLAGIVSTIREADLEMPAQTLATLVEIARNPGLTMAELQAKVGLSSAGISRAVARLTEWEKPKVPGLDFVVRTENPADRRNKVVTLTQKGSVFVRKLLKRL